jgi:hypothetical protein
MTYWQITEHLEDCANAIRPLIDNFWDHLKYKVVRKVVHQIEVHPQSANKYALQDVREEECMIVLALRGTDLTHPNHIMPILECAVQWAQRPYPMEPLIKDHNVHLVSEAIRQDHIMLGNYVVLNIMWYDVPPHADEAQVLDMSTLTYMHDMYGLKVLSTSNHCEYATLCGYILFSENHYVTYCLKSESKDILEGDWLYCNDDTVYAGVDEGLILAGFAYCAIYQKTVEAEYHRVLHYARMKVIWRKEEIVQFWNMFLLLHPNADETVLHAAVQKKFFSLDMHQHLLWPTGEPDNIGKIYVS